MLDINKIDSDFNRNNLHVTDIAKILDQPYTTVVHKKKKGNWTPNDIEKIAEYFNRSILYYFDKEEGPDTTQEPTIKYYSCQDCIKKQRDLDDMRTERDALRLEVLELYRGKKTENCG